MNVDRRTALQALTGLCAAALVGPAVAAAPGSALTAAQFGALSSALTGYPAPDAETSAKMLRAFATPARRAPLSALARLVATTPAVDLDAALHTNKLDGIAADLVAAWFSGVVTTAQGQQLVLYANAYVWSAMRYTKPVGMCGGATGYWSNPPA